MHVSKQFDIGIYGLWYGRNYGSMATYYALNTVLNDMGYSTVMIENPLRRESFDLNQLPQSHPLRFAESHYYTTDLYRMNEMASLNTVCKAFVLGSDQMWNYGLSRNYKESYFLDFAANNRLKISYGTSFGKHPYNGPKDYKPVVQANLKRFDAISVRDTFSKDIVNNEFGVEAEQVLDPVFLCPKPAYEKLIEESSAQIKGDYIFAYILDPNEEMGRTLEKVAEHSELDLYIVFDEPANDADSFKSLNISNNRISYIPNPDLGTWLSLFAGAQYVLSDSFHGACFSLIFQKDFLILQNSKRGGSRFVSLLEPLNALDRMVLTQFGMGERFLEDYRVGHIDYVNVNSRLKPLVDDSKAWLEKALEPIEDIKLDSRIIMPETTQKKPEHADIQRCKMVAGLLRDYNIRHVVVSSGARDVSIVRLFEENDCFETHNVLDERSAAYYALGLALQLNEPVAITCTSGTAVSNYLPGITEAYYMQVPIVVVSGDRYPYFLGQMEAQKIDHIGALSSVVKASVDLPIGWDGMIQWDSRRKISEALLEMTHHGSGPVHINLPMSFLENKYPDYEGAFDIPSYRHISRITPTDEQQVFNEALKKLRSSKKILLISGQAQPLSAKQQKNFDDFCRKFNCCVVTDHLSNLHGKYTLNPFNMLRKTGSKFFIENLMPDLVLYIGGKRVLNDPLQGKMRSIPRDFEFWRIDPDGKVADLYRTLTHVFEMTPDKFFETFVSLSSISDKNDGVYYSQWRDHLNDYPQVDYKSIEVFNSSYTIGSTMAKLPKNSILHLGVGTSFNRAHFYDLDSSVQVHCNMGTNGIDGSTSTFMGQALMSNRPSYLFIGDLSFFYDMNSLWNKPMMGNIRILLNNDSGAGFLRHFATKGITHKHNATAKGWVESLGFTYLSARTIEEFEQNVGRFTSAEDTPMFFEAFVQ